MIIPTLTDFYVYGFPLFSAFLLYLGFREKRRYFYKKARIQFIMENYYT